MRLKLLAFVLAATSAHAATAVLEGPPPRAITEPKSIASPVNPGVVAVPIADLYSVRGATDAAWTPDGRDIVIATDITGRLNLWKMPSDGGFPLQLTQSDDRQYGMAISPDGKTLIYESDFGGAEISDLYAMPLAGGAVVDLTGTKDISENAARFLPDGRRIVFSRRLATGASIDIAIMDVASRKTTLLTHETAPGYFWFVAGITADGKTLIANRINVAETESTVWRIDVDGGKAEALTDTAPTAFNSASAASGDGSTIALTTETADGTRQAALFDAATRTTKLVKPDAWEQGAGSLSADGRTMIFSSNVDGRTELFADTDGKISRVGLPPGLNIEARAGYSLSPDGTKLLVTHEASNTPNDYWSVDLNSGRTTQLTHLSIASVSPATLPPSQLVHYKSEDGTVISAFLWVPFNLKRDGKAPGVVVAHGGPTGQTTDYFSRMMQSMASRGYVVIAPNPRGSSGYGRAFLEANRKDLGGGDLTDEVYAAKFMSATGYVDAKKVGITGGSYGGYMTLMAVGKTPDIWAAGVEQYGIIDWFSMYEHGTPELLQYQIGLLGDSVKNRAVYVAASPMTYMGAAKAPLLVLQGENDIRVPREQAQMVVDKLKGQGTVVDAHFYAGEGHGFAKRENQVDATERMLAWFEKYLKGK